MCVCVCECVCVCVCVCVCRNSGGVDWWVHFVNRPRAEGSRNRQAERKILIERAE